jgi:hypothetical protein
MILKEDPKEGTETKRLMRRDSALKEDDSVVVVLGTS